MAVVAAAVCCVVFYAGVGVAFWVMISNIARIAALSVYTRRRSVFWSRSAIGAFNAAAIYSVFQTAVIANAFVSGLFAFEVAQISIRTAL